MRHLLVSYHACPLEEPGVGLAGGMNVFLRGLLRALAGRGVRTLVLTRGTGTASAVTRPFPGVRIRHVPCGWREPPSRESAYEALPRFVEAARDVLARSREPWDAVSAHYWMSGIAARELGFPFVFMYHTVEAFKHAPAEVPSRGLSALRMEAERELASAARRAVFFSEEDFARTRDLFPALERKGAVIPPGVDDAFRRPPPREAARERLCVSPEEFLFLLAARPDPVKNVDSAIAAFRILRKETGSRVRLLVAGQKIPQGDLPEGASCAGTIPHSGMPGIFSAADAVLCPSGYESFGLVPLEAMAAGVPVIVPAPGFWGKKIRAGGGGRVYDPGSEKGLLAAMAAVSSAEPSRVRNGKKGKRLAAPFTWEKCAESWAALLSSVSRPDSPR